ncbi:hypothetical protein M3667_15425 [Microbacterium sp. P26]|uniref:hypothetical protein n=1 Tax=Microbacterium TaxID=33882 RepID=UPI002040BC37|nr:hypothetical protein [Microbacterium sp. P26]MCM3503262.1 hypothetical protein [Microbacterium sp. P26]
MSTDDEQLYALHDEVTRKADQMKVALSVDGTAATEDPHRQIAVRWTDGGPEIEIGTFWRTAIAPEELATAVLTTVGTAAVERLSAWTQAFGAEAPTVPTPSTLTATRRGGEIDRLIEDADGDALHRNVNRFLEDYSQRLRQSLEIVRERASRATTASDRDGRVRVVLGPADDLRELEFDREWLRSADGAEVTAALRAALANARATSDESTPQGLFAGTPLDVYATELADPVELVRMLTRGE